MAQHQLLASEAPEDEVVDFLAHGEAGAVDSDEAGVTSRPCSGRRGRGILAGVLVAVAMLCFVLARRSTATTSLATIFMSAPIEEKFEIRVSYVGCFNSRQISSHRSLPHKVMSEHATPETCAAECLRRGKEYKFFGLQDGRECWCGTGPELGDELSHSKCNYHCEDFNPLTLGGVAKWTDPQAQYNKICGGYGRNSVYSLEEIRDHGAFDRTVGNCRGGDTYPGWGTLWKCVAPGTKKQCEIQCLADDNCGAFDREFSSSGECCLFLKGNTGDDNAGHECFVKTPPQVHLKSV